MGALVSGSKRNQPHSGAPAAVLLPRKNNGTLGAAAHLAGLHSGCELPPTCPSFSTCSLVALATLAWPHL